MASTKVAYDENAIQTLDALEHIRLRSGMYIGRLGDGSHALDGIYVMLKEVDRQRRRRVHHGRGQARRDPARGRHAVSVRDYGRGIPLGKLVDCVSRSTRAASTTTTSSSSRSASTASAPRPSTRCPRSSRCRELARRQVPRADLRARQAPEGQEGQGRRERPQRHLIRFTPDPRSSGLRLERGVHRAPAALLRLPEQRPHARLQRQETSTVEERPEGPARPTSSARSQPLYDIVHCKLGDRLEFAFTHTNAYGENYFSFVNGQYTNDGGTHQSAFREGCSRA